MSLPIAQAKRALDGMRQPEIRNLIAQSKAKQVLREVHEAPTNFPRFTANLDERVTFVAYGRLAAGCSMVEFGDAAGYAEIQAAAEALESVHRTEALDDRGSGFHCLIGSMAFYACGQYSRGFVLIKGVEAVTPAAAIIAAFLRKDTRQLIPRINAVLLSEPASFDDEMELDEFALTTSIARAVSTILEHIFSGEPGLLATADEILRDALIITENGSYPSFWWLARILRLMLADYSNGSLWRALPPFFDPDGTSQITNYVRLLAFGNPPVTELWQSQRACLELALNSENRGGVINLRTSGGKTRVAELAILKTLKNNPGSKVLFLAPFRSLAFEMERTFVKFLAPLGYPISHLYGGSRFSGLDRELVNEANLIIATPEKAKAMLRAAPELFEGVKLVVVDGGHLLGENQRNVRNELFLEHLRLLCRQRQARMLFVEFKEVGKTKKKRRFPRNKVEAVAATAVRLAELGPVLIFAGQAKWVRRWLDPFCSRLGMMCQPIHGRKLNGRFLRQFATKSWAKTVRNLSRHVWE